MAIYPTKFVQYYIDSIRYYENIVTSLVERGHIVLKSILGVWICDFLTIVTNIDFILQNQHPEYIIALGKTINNMLMIFKRGNIVVYQDLIPYITPFVLFKIHI